MLASEAKGRPVMSTETATAVGKIDGLLVDPATSKVVAFSLTKTHGDADALHWEDLTSFGPDAVTVDAEALISKPRGWAAELSGKHLGVLGKRVLTDKGVELGTVDDLEFDPKTGDVLALVTGAEAVDGKRMLGLGSYALVVRTA